MITRKYSHIFVTAITAASLMGCATLASPQGDTRTITVDGEARIKVSPDMFSVNSVLSSKNADQGVTLTELSGKLERVRQTLPHLAGLTFIEIDSSDLTLSPVYDLACLRQNDYDSPQLCPVTGRTGSIELTIKASPANRAGQLVSLLSELGAESVEVNSFFIADPKASRDQAVTAAVEDARAKAAAIANAAGATISGVDRVQYGSGFRSDNDRDVVIVTANKREDEDPEVRVVPTVDLNIDPAPIYVSAKVTVSFGIKR